jgi:ubiquinone/menaquinone biosynthesis C-methylase UbiE
MNGAWWDAFAQAGGFEDLETWLGGIDHASRVRIRERIAECNYETVLDCGAGLGLDYIGMSNLAHPVSYAGIEPSKEMRQAAQEMIVRYETLRRGDEIPIVEGSIQEIPYPDSSFDLVYARHILEHLPRIDDAVAEMVRVARLEVIIVFFMRPGKETYLTRERDGLWQNWWSKDTVEAEFAGNDKVEVFFWESLGTEVLFHAYLKDATKVEPSKVAERMA